MNKLGLPPAGGFGSPAAGFGTPGFERPRYSPFAVGAMSVGLFSIPGSFGWAATLPLAAAGLALGVVALRRIRARPDAWKGQALAIAGMVCSAVSILVAMSALLLPWDQVVRSLVGPHG